MFDIISLAKFGENVIEATKLIFGICLFPGLLFLLHFLVGLLFIEGFKDYIPVDKNKYMIALIVFWPIVFVVLILLEAIGLLKEIYGNHKNKKGEGTNEY